MFGYIASASGGGVVSGGEFESYPIGIEFLLDIIMQIYNSIYEFFTNSDLWLFLTKIVFELEYYSIIKQEIVTEPISLIRLMFGSGIIIVATIVMGKWIKEIVIS